MSQRPFKDTKVWLQAATQLYAQQAFAEARDSAAYSRARPWPNARRSRPGSMSIFAFRGRRRPTNPGRLPRRSSIEGLSHRLRRVSPGGRRVYRGDRHRQAAPGRGSARRPVHHPARERLPIVGTIANGRRRFQAALQECPADDEETQREIRRLLAGNYLRRRLFDPARMQLEELLEQQPTDIASRILLIETLIKAGDCDTASRLATEGLKNATPRERMRAADAARLRLSRAGRATARQPKRFAPGRGSQCGMPDVAYGLYRSATKLKQPQLAHEAHQPWPFAFGTAGQLGCKLRRSGRVVLRLPLGCGRARRRAEMCVRPTSPS